jgi:hypothetical protein
MPVLDREEYIEQAYFFNAFRERVMDGIPSQDVLERIGEELLSTTKLPLAVSFLHVEIKGSGLMGPAMARIQHYFTPFQTHVVSQAEMDLSRFPMDQALLILEREARYKSESPTQAGLFVYQFEAISRNRLGYDPGLQCLREDFFYDVDWQAYIDLVRRQVGAVDFADLVYLRSELYVLEQRRRDPDYLPPLPPLFGEKEGKIARANRGRDPLYLFAALQRQLGYPEVPRARGKDDPMTQIQTLRVKIKELETRLKLVEGEVRGRVDLSEFMAKPELLPPPEDDE